MFNRLTKIISDNDLKIIANTKILLIGLGGVGGSAFEALIRSGIINITVIDNDQYDITNLNRQILATNTTINKSKVLVAKDRALSINPNCQIAILNMFLDEHNLNEINIKQFDYVIDACDTIKTKIALIKVTNTNNIKLISCLGTGNRFHPEQLEITTLNKTSGDPLARIIRHELNKLDIKDHIKVVWSRELPCKTGDRIPGSIAPVPNAAGLLLASYVLNDIIQK